MINSLKKIFRYVIGSENNGNDLINSTSRKLETPILLPDPDIATHARAQNDEEFSKRYLRAWETGDWQTLATINLFELESHPQRVDLALLKGAALFQLGDSLVGKQIFQKAAEWGASRKIISKILVAGTHRNLSRANQYIGNNCRSLAHLDLSADVIASANAKIRSTTLKKLEQKYKLETTINDTVTSQENTPYACKEPKNEHLHVAEKYSGITDELSALRKLIESISVISKEQHNALDELFRIEIENSKLQLESFIAINNYLRTGEFIGNFHGFPISPDVGLYMVQLLEENSYTVIIEFGSGTSTVILARASSLISTRKIIPQPIHIAFEHLEEYHKKTKKMLESSQLETIVDVQLTHLDGYSGPNNRQYRYYDCQKQLHSLNERLGSNEKKILVIVDGPPGSACKHSRYPAVPIVVSMFPDAHIDILLDDYDRQDEKEIVTEWITYLESKKIKIEIIEKNFEKGACLISLRTPKNLTLKIS